MLQKVKMNQAADKDIKTSKQVADCKEDSKQEETDFSSDSHPPQAQEMLEMVFTEGLTPEIALMELDSPLAEAETGGSEIRLPVKKRRGRPPGSKAQKKMPENILTKPQTIETDNQSTIQTSDPLCIENDSIRDDSAVIGQDPLVGAMLIEPGPQLQPKKRRGRKPREKVPPPLIKRGRGRPRIRPIQPKPDQLAADSYMDPNQPAQLKMEQYDFSNLPFGDIEYLTRPLRNKTEITKLKEGAPPDERSLHHEVVLEPVVEIKTEPEDRPPTPENIAPIVENEIEPPTLEKSPEASSVPPPPPPPSLPPETTLTRVVLPSSSAENQPTTSKGATFEKKVAETTSKLTMFENQIAKIGECTISVANV